MLLIAVFLPRKVELSQSAILIGKPEEVSTLLFDLSNWPDLMVWRKYNEELKIAVSSGSDHLGANIYVESKHLEVEITITHLSKNALHYSILIDREHSLFGRFSLLDIHGNTQLNHTLEGTIHATLTGGIIVLYIHSLINNMFTSCSNNINTKLKLLK